MNTFFASWSGGKDSCFAVMSAIQSGYKPGVLLNMMNEHGLISRSHGIPRHILQQQSESASIPLETRSASWAEYESVFVDALMSLREKYHVQVAVFGDIDLEPHREWEEKVCARAGLVPLLPLWQQPRKSLVMQMIQAGIRAHIVSCNHVMGPQFLGRLVDEKLVDELEAIGVDPCGENGEYHTLVVDCPLFRFPVQVSFGRSLSHDNYWFVEML